jgi:hypothetical protein
VAGGGPPFGSLTAFLVAAADVGAERGQAPPRPARRAPLRRAPRASPRPQSTLPRRTPMATPRRGPTAPPRESPVTQPSTAPPLLPPYDTAPHGTAPTLGWPEWRMAYGNLENSIPLTGASPEASAEGVNDQPPGRATSFRGRGSSIPGRGGRAPRRHRPHLLVAHPWTLISLIQGITHSEN